VAPRSVVDLVVSYEVTIMYCF